ncbi:MAG: molybdopterin-dependent oxidoreductase, partial [Pseudomonadales bacterium]|nr:molybdopterin-dependent oxidoreductase [Pseudomonadales bacterium]
MFKSDQQEQSLPVAESTPVANMQLSRRQFMVTGVQSGAALMLGVTVGQEALAAAGTLKGNASALQPNAFVCITPDNQVCITIKHLEMGQGTFTGLATLVAEELDASWSQVTCEGAEANAGKYANLAWGKFQGTGGSTAIANAFMQMREAGASARAMLVSAAASLWQVPAREIKVSNGIVSHPASGKQSEFGALAELAAMQKIPEKVILKKSDQFTLIGKKLPRKDVGKTTGQALYTQDMQQPGTLTALVAHPPRFGAKMLSFDASAAEKQKGVVAVVALENRVAVLAKDFWQAKKARDLLVIKWDEQAAFKQSSADLLADYKALADKPGLVAHQTGSIAQGFDQADKVIEAEYAFPFLAHAAMEPMNCVVQLRKQGDKILGAELWYGAQMHTGDQMALAGLLQVAPEQVKINTLYAGGSFGRRANSKSDYVLEAAEIAKAYGGNVPVKLV